MTQLKLHKALDLIVGGWQTSTVATWASGLPLSMTAQNTLAAYGYAVQRPNFQNLKDLNQGDQTPDRWFNTSAVLQPGRYEIGIGPRFIPTFARVDPTTRTSEFSRIFELGSGWTSSFAASR